jgi:hypothetical protein
LSGGVALIVLSYPLRGVSRAAFGLLGILAKIVEKKAPRQERLISNIQSGLGIATLFAGGLTFIYSGESAGGIARVSMRVVKTSEDAPLMPWVEKKYLSAN